MNTRTGYIGLFEVNMGMRIEESVESSQRIRACLQHQLLCFSDVNIHILANDPVGSHERFLIHFKNSHFRTRQTLIFISVRWTVSGYAKGSCSTNIKDRYSEPVDEALVLDSSGQKSIKLTPSDILSSQKNAELSGQLTNSSSASQIPNRIRHRNSKNPLHLVPPRPNRNESSSRHKLRIAAKKGK